MSIVFSAQQLENMHGKSLSGALNTQRWKKTAIFDRNRRISRRQYQLAA